MTEPALSIVIPTRNRCEVLRLTLVALGNQEGVTGDFEVIVADDGSTDDTQMTVQSGHYSYDLRALSLDSGGPARARNAAIRQARAGRILLLGDDMIPAPGNLKIHIAASGEREGAVQGAIEWDPEIGITDVMRFLAPEGPQFWFKGLEDGAPVPWTSIVSSNLSAPTHWFVEEPFDEEFTEACVEDTELAWRWARRGWPTVFNRSALSLHHHRYDDIETFLDRQRRAGTWTRTVIAKHPKLIARLGVLPIVKAVFRELQFSTGLSRKIDREHIHWELGVQRSFLRGLFGRQTRGKPDASG